MNPKRHPLILWAVCLVCPLLSSQLAIAKPRGGDAKTLTYAGSVTDEARLPIAGVQVRATPLEEGGEPQITVTDQQGRFVLPDVQQFYHDRTWRYLVFEHPDYGVAWRLLTEFDARNPNFDPADLHARMLPRVEFGGQVADLAGKPVRSAEVSAHLKQQFAVTPRMQRFSYYSVTATTDDQGHFRFPNLPKGVGLELQVCHPNYVTLRHRAEHGDLPYKAGGEPIKVQLLPGASVEGQLLFNGKPLPQSGVMIHVTDPLNGEAAGWVRTDAEGHYRITGLEAKSFAVHVLAGQELFGGLTAAPVRNVTTQTGKAVVADLICVRGVPVTGRVADQQGRAVGQSYVGARLSDLPAVNLYSTSSAENGGFELRLPPGSYDVKTTDWRPVPPFEAVQKVVVADAPPTPIGFQVTNGAAAKIRLVDTTGRAVTGSATIYETWNHSDNRGDVAFGFAPGGRSMHAGFAISDDKTLAAGFYWPADEQKLPREVALKPPATIVGRVLDESGARITADMFVFAWSRTDGPQSAVGWTDGIAWPAIEDDGSFRVKLPAGVRLAVTLFDGRQEKTILPATDLEPGETRDVGVIRLPRPER